MTGPPPPPPSAAPHPDERLLVDLWAWPGSATVVVRRSLHPHRRVAHTVLALSRHDEIHAVHTSTSPASPTLLSVPDVPTQGHEVALGDPALGLTARLRWVPTGEAAAEPMLVLDRAHEHLRDDVATTCGELSGVIELDGEQIELVGSPGVGERRAGVVPADLPPGPLERPHDELPTRLWLRVLVRRPDGPATFTCSWDGQGRVELATAWTPTHGSVPAAGTQVRLSWWPGSRRPRAIQLPTLPGDTGPTELRVRSVVPAALLGGLGATWPLAGWVGAEAARRVRYGAEEVTEGPSQAPWGAGPLSGVAHHGFADVVGAPEPVGAVVEVTALGPHEASGLSGWTTGA